MSSRGAKQGAGGSSYRQNIRSRVGSRGHHILNAPREALTIWITKRGASEVVQQNPEWIVNALDCAQQILRQQGIQLTSLPTEMRSTITAAIATTVQNWKTLPLPVTEGQNAFGRRNPDDQTRQHKPNLSASPYPSNEKQKHGSLDNYSATKRTYRTARQYQRAAKTSRISYRGSQRQHTTSSGLKQNRKRRPSKYWKGMYMIKFKVLR